MKTFRAKRCFPCLALGGTGLHAIGNARAVRGRSTGGCSGHSNPTAPATGSAPATGTRGRNGGHPDAPLAISDGRRATVILPHPQQRLRSSSAIGIRAGRT